MKKILLLVAFFTVGFLWRVNAQISTYYTFSESVGTFTDLVGGDTILLGLNSDDGEQTGIPIGFTFNYVGTDYTQLAIDANGAAGFNNSSVNYTNNLEGTVSSNTNVLAPLWDDMYQRTADTGVIYYGTIGVAPNRVFVIEWKNISWRTAGNKATFQIALFETSNNIAFNYGANTSTESRSASIGFNNGTTGTDFISITPGSPATSSLVTENSSISSADYPGDGVTYLFTYAAPSCPVSTNLMTANLSSTSVDLLWTTGGAFNWFIEWDTAGFTQGTGNLVTVSGTDSFHLTGLMANTDYEWYVMDSCGVGDLSNWVGPNAFFTGYCASSGSNSTRYIDNFETTGGAVNISNLLSGYSTNGFEDFSPMEVSTYSGSTLLNFTASVIGGTQGFNVWVDWNNDLDFDDTGENLYHSGYANSYSGSFTIPSGLALGSYKMRIKSAYFSSDPSACGASSGGGETEEYIFTIIATPPCSPPTIDSTSNITATSADLYWTTGGSTNWDIEWGIAGFTQGSGTMISNTATNPNMLSGLNPATNYEFYVRDLCGSDTSTWAGPFAFLTLCPTNYAAPFCETFDGGSVSCWGNETVTDQFNWFLRTGSTPSFNTGPDAAHGGTQYIYTETSGTSNGDTAILYSPAIDLTALTTPTIDFYYHMYGVGMDTDGTFAVDVSNDGGTTWTNVFSEMGNHGNQWNNGYVEMASFAGDTVIFRFLGVVSTTGTTYQNDFALDDFCVIEALPCPGAPSNLSVSNLMANSTDLNWVNTFSATNWIVEWDTVGFTIGTGNSVSATDTFASIIGLSGNTTYDFYVRDYCGSTDSSNWAGPFTFSTPCDIYTPYYMEDFATFTPTCWEEYTDGTINQGPTGAGAGSWGTDGFANVGFSGSARINIFGSFVMNDWIVSPGFDLSAGGYELIFDVAGTAYASSVNPAAMGSDDTLALVISEDGGTTWSIEKMWSQGSEPSIAGDNIRIYLSSVSPNTIFGFYGTNGTTSGGDNDLFIDNFIICTPVINLVAIATDLCDGDSLMLSTGMAVTTAGMFNDTLMTSTGCDSIITYDVTILMPSFDTTDITICQGTPFTLPGGTIITSAGTYNEMFTNTVGCDSTVTYNVVVNVATSSMQAVHLCDGATFTLPLSGLVVSMANDYVETTTNAVGCDSTITYNVTTGMSSADTINVDLCTGSMYITPDGDTITTAGMHTFTFVNATGCNHTSTYNVTMKMPSASTVVASGCESYTWTLDGNSYTSSGMYTYTTMNAVGCDSVITLDLTINSPTASSMTASACASYTWAVNGNSYTSSGMYTYTTTNANGCDSIITLNLTINVPTASNMSETICSGDAYQFGTQSLTSAGTYTETFTNAAGCDSIVTLTLMVDNASDNNESASICSGDTYQFGTQSLTSAGTYTESFTNNNGCSYTTTLTLTVNNTTSSSQNIILCEQDNNQFTLANGTVVTEAGTYTATVTGSNGCDETITYVISDCVGIFDIDNNVGITLFPNPAKDVLNVVFSEKLSNTNNITVVDLLGKVIYTLDNVKGVNLTINTSKIANGLYYLNVRSDNKTSVKSFTISK